MLSKEEQHQKIVEEEKNNERKQQMQAELNDFYERREVHQRTPRKFNENKGELGEEMLYDRF